MKKALSILLVLTMLFSLVACGKTSETTSETTQQPVAAEKKLDYPKRTIELVIPFGAAGSADICFRSVGTIMADKAGVSVNAVNKSGAGGVTGLSYAYDQDADGYTLCAVTPSMPIAEAKGTFKFIDGFEPVALMEMDIFIISVLSTNKDFNDLDSMIKYAKAHPGEVTIGGTSAGGLDEYEARQFGEACGIELTFVPYDGGGEHKAAFLGGELSLYMDKLSSFTSMMQYEQVKPIVVLNKDRLNIDGLKDVPTSVEKGINFTTGSWRGLVVKKGTPEEVIDYLSNLCKEIYESPEFQKTLENDNANLSYGYKNREEFKSLIASEVEAYKKVVAQFG